MPTVKEIIEHLQTMQPDDHIAAHIWSTEDVFEVARQRSWCLTLDQANAVIENVERHKDSTLGITWTTLECALDEIENHDVCQCDSEDDERNCYQCEHFKGANHAEVPNH